MLLAMPELLQSAKLAIEKGQAAGRDETYLKQLADYIIPALVEALHKVYICILCFIWFGVHFYGLPPLVGLHGYAM